MQTSRAEFRHNPQQPTLSLEMFLDREGTSPGGAPRIPVADLNGSRTCKPSKVWKTLAQTERERIKNRWMRMMREVADDDNER